MSTENAWRMIIGKLTRQLSAEEEEEFEQWFVCCRENREMFYYYRRLFEAVRRLYRVPEPDVEVCLKELPLRTSFFTCRFLKYAAVFIVLFLSSIFVRDVSERKSPAVLPGAENSCKIRLLLSSGKVVEISPEDKFRLEESSGVYVYNSGYTLNYAENPTTVPCPDTGTKYNKLLVPRGTDCHLILTDGTEVWLNAESELEYPVGFVNDTLRRVFLKGEAYFKVNSSCGKPFRVEAGDISVEVSGTSFNLMSYEGMPCVEVTLEEGELEVRAGETNIFLHSGMQAVFSGETRILEAKYVNTALYTSWKDRILLFEKIRLEDFLEKMGRRYDVNIVYRDSTSKEILLTGNLGRHESIETILQILEAMGKLEFSYERKTIIVMKSRE